MQTSMMVSFFIHSIGYALRIEISSVGLKREMERERERERES